MYICDVYRYFEMLNCNIGNFLTDFQENVLHWVAKYRKILFGQTLLHTRPNTENCIPVYSL